MRKGYTIDCKYIRRVKDYMELPRPKHKSKFIVNHGEILPIILVESGEVWKHVATANMPMNIFRYGSTLMVIQDVVFIIGILLLGIVVMILN